ncbi:MAG: glycosyltransferase family 39 protein [Opitutus sp.]
MQTQNPPASGSFPEQSVTTVTSASSLSHETAVDRAIARSLFCALALFHLWAVLVGWRSGLLQGNEFRQTQTALTTLFVQREQNFSLSYPTPVLGKPWSVPMEFPLYQWTVAVVSSATGLPLIQSARAVSCVCFYLTLPAIWLLLRRMKLREGQRWIALGVMLTCPLYIFYSRAFLIETMALMFSLWFLQSFLAAMEQRSAFWLIVANLAGIGAGLVKVTTFIVYLVPAGICAAYWLWQRARAADTFPKLRPRFWRLLGWIVAATVIPFLATVWWIKLADAIKALNPSGVQLVSSSMSSYHFGTWQTRLSTETWASHWRTLTTNIMPIASLAAFGCVTAFLGGRWRKWIVGLTALFVTAPLTFPVLYAWHEYYWVANTALLLAATGLALAALLDSTAPRWTRWTIIVGVNAIQCWGFIHYLYPTQRLPYEGGSGLTRLLHDVTDPQDVLLIAGNDWSSVVPFYAERRALMIRTHLERDGEYLNRAFAAISDESVPVLVLMGDLRRDTEFLARASRQFDLDPRPFLRHKDETVYVNRSLRKEYGRRLFNLSYNDVTFADAAEHATSNQPQSLTALRTTRFFTRMSPRPDRYQVPFGLSLGFRPDGSLVFDAHAPTRLWFHPPRRVTQLSLEFGIAEDAYTRAGDRTDGVEFVAVVRAAPGATERALFSRVLDPVRQPLDRGTQRAKVSLALPENAEVIIETRPGPGGSNAFDWSYWRTIEFH